MPEYFLIISSEDGISITEYSKAELLETVQENIEAFNWRVFDELPDDLEYQLGMWVIEGKLVKPTPKEVVTKWDIKD